MSKRNGTAKCPKCFRILHLVEGKIPMHRTPPPENERGSTPLPDPNEPWCSRRRSSE